MSFLQDLIKYNLIARVMMFVSTAMSWRAAEWFMHLPPEAQTTQAASFVSVIMGVYTGVFGIWIGSEGKKGDR